MDSVSAATPPEYHNECWNEPSDTRRNILNRLKAVLAEKLNRKTVPSSFWAFCQVADLTKLEKLVTLALSSQDTEIVELLLEPTIKDCDSIIDRWLQKISTAKSSTTTSASHWQRSNSASKNCKRRDNDKCILTRMAEPDAAHIHPHCLIKASTREPRSVGRFWDIMNVFWEKRRVETWKAEIFGDPETLSNPKDGCFNMLSLDKSAHALWGAGRFALRPIEAVSLESISVQFFWQLSSSNGVAEIDLSTVPESSRGVYGDKDYSIPVFTGKYKDSGKPIYRAIASGDVFTIRTDDARNLPLPSWALLEMQWFLQRVAGMSGAAEEAEISDYSDCTDTAAPSIDAVRRTREISHWLEVLPQNDEEFEPSQTTVQVYHVTTTELQGTGRQNEDL